MTMELAQRRRIGRLVRAALVVLGLVIGGAWLAGRLHSRGGGETVSRRIATVETLQPGDVQVTSVEGGVSVTLQGDRILAGLSPQTVEKIRAELEQSAKDDTSGIGGSIAQIVKKTVSANIDAQIAYPISSVREITFDDGLIVLHTNDGKAHRLFSDSKVSGEKPRFLQEDAERLIAAFEARKDARP